MAKYILIPDSFKGTLSSREVCEIMQAVLSAYEPQAQICAVPVADGGEGSVDCFLQALGGRRVNVAVQGPFGAEMTAQYGLLADGKTAVVEMAACAGLPLVEDCKDVLRTTTYGVGQLIAHAVQHGCTKVIVCLGGSATNDLGAGCAAALGVRFWDEQGLPYVPTGGTLSRLAHVDISQAREALRGVQLVVMCDIDNPLYGEQGAAYIYGPQKGADAATVALLDAGLRHAEEIVRRDCGVHLADMPGAGAAGGMGYGLAALLQGNLQRGIDTVLDTVRFEELLQDASCVFTGEGKLDAQSLRGKVVIGVARRCQQAHVPVMAVVGVVDCALASVYAQGVTAVAVTNKRAADFSAVRLHAAEDLRETMDNLCRSWQLAKAMIAPEALTAIHS